MGMFDGAGDWVADQTAGAIQDRAQGVSDWANDRVTAAADRDAFADLAADTQADDGLFGGDDDYAVADEGYREQADSGIEEEASFEEKERRRQVEGDGAWVPPVVLPSGRNKDEDELSAEWVDRPDEAGWRATNDALGDDPDVAAQSADDELWEQRNAELADDIRDIERATDGRTPAYDPPSGFGDDLDMEVDLAGDAWGSR